MLCSQVHAASILNWNTEGDGGTTWSGWTYSEDVKQNSTNYCGFYRNDAGWCAQDWRPIIWWPTGYTGQVNEGTIDATVRAPSTSTGASLKVWDGATATSNQPSWWIYYNNRMGETGLADETTNRLGFYIKLQDVNAATMSAPYGTGTPVLHVGTYLCSDGYCCIDGDGDSEGPGNRKFYHVNYLEGGAWIHWVQTDHPERIRGDTQNMSQPISPYYADLAHFYVEVRNGQTSHSTMWTDEVETYSVSNENNVSVGNMAIGYWSDTDTWKIWWTDPYTWEAYGSGWSTYQIRYSTSPITNENWSSATQIEPLMHERSTSNDIRRIYNDLPYCYTEFYIPDELEAGNNRIYFAIKDVSLEANGDAHSADDFAAQANITTIDYYLRADGGASIINSGIRGGGGVR